MNLLKNVLLGFVESLGIVLSAFPVTVLIMILSLIFGAIFGAFLTFIRLRKRPISYAIATTFISFMRGTPMLVQLFLVYYGIPKFLQPLGIDLSDTSPVIFAIITFSLNSASFLSEVFRSAYLAVDKGQQEAAFSVGLTNWQTVKRIIFPQALKIALPNIGNSVIDLFKETSLAYSIGVLDMLGKARQIIALDYGLKLFQIYIAVDIVYWICCIIIEKIMNSIENDYTW